MQKMTKGTNLETDDFNELVANCENEALHLSGQIQGFGGAFFIDNESLTVTAASENIAEYCPLSVAQLVGTKVHDLTWLPLELLYNLGIKAGNRAYAFNDNTTTASLNYRSHRSDAGILIEIERSTATVTQRQYLQLRASILPRIDASWQEHDYWNQLIHTLDEFLPCERIVLYRFNEHWSGEVVAEKVVTGLPPYLGLKFPASDIPAIARQMYYQNPSRYIADSRQEAVNFLTQYGTPLDLTYSDLRSVSPLHGEYLQNMGVATSFSVPIMQTGKLWGIISCHHATATPIDAHLRYQAEGLVKYFSMIYSTYQSKKRLALLTSLDDEVSVLAQKLRIKGEQSIPSFLQAAKTAFQASGAAMYINDDWHLCLPKAEQRLVRDIDNACRHDTSDVLLSKQDIREVDGLASVSHEEVRGVMLIRLNFELKSLRLYVFRQPEKQITHWAGNPDKTMQKVNSHGVLSPRASFEKWSEVDGEQSLPWSKRDLLLAKKLRAALIRLLT